MHKKTTLSGRFKTPGDGFEPPLKEPESFVLPLDDPGLLCFSSFIDKIILSFENLKASIFSSWGCKYYIYFSVCYDIL